MNRLVNELKSAAAANGRDDLEIAVEHLNESNGTVRAFVTTCDAMHGWRSS